MDVNISGSPGDLHDTFLESQDEAWLESNPEDLVSTGPFATLKMKKTITTCKFVLVTNCNCVGSLTTKDQKESKVSKKPL